MNSSQDEYNNFKELFDGSKADISSYIEKRLMLVKLQAYEKMASSFSYIAYSLIICLLMLLLLTLMFFGLGLFIGEQLDNYSLGFGVLALFVLLVLLMIILTKKRVRRFLVNTSLRTIKKIEKDED